MIKNGRRAQSAGAVAGFLAFLAAFIVLYMMVIPPDLREELLYGNSAGTGSKASGTDSPSSFAYESVLLDESPGRINYLKFSEYEHPLPALNLYSTSAPAEADIGDSVYIKNGVFDARPAEISFSVSSPGDIDNAYMTFNTNRNRNSRGRLMIYLNDKTIYDRDLGSSSPEPIKISSSSLKENNVLRAEVSGVGWRFWSTNEYELDDIMFFYERKDTSTQKSKNIFTISDIEKFNLKETTLKFLPECQQGSVGLLEVYVNNNLLYSAVPDCGQLNRFDIPPAMMEAGENKVIFESKKGRYMISAINVVTKMKEMTYPVYYFDMNKGFFENAEDGTEEDHECGDIDGYCPSGCDPDLDKDCCLEKTSYYWCDRQPDNQDDRCRAITALSQCSLCAAGYEDDGGDPPEICEDLCGDDTDNDCPAGCSRLYDMDCCFEDSEDNFWCDDVPLYGLSQCKEGITEDECEACYDGWDSESSRFSCRNAGNDNDGHEYLKSRYRVKATFSFLDDGERKAATVYVNGYKFNIDTYKDEFSRYIDDYVEEGSNAIKIEPDRTIIEIRKLSVEVVDK